MHTVVRVVGSPPPAHAKPPSRLRLRRYRLHGYELFEVTLQPVVVLLATPIERPQHPVGFFRILGTDPCATRVTRKSATAAGSTV